MAWIGSQRLRCGVRSLAARMGQAACGLLLLFLAVATARAQKPKVETFSVGDGLPSATIYDLEQDASGRIWILSRAGLTVYDGRSFYRPTSVESLPGHRLAALEVDFAGRLWTVARSEKLVYTLEGATWRRLPPASGSEAGLLRWATSMLVPERDRPSVIVGTTDEGLLIWDGAAWVHADQAEELELGWVTCLEPAAGEVFVGTDAGLCTLEASRLDCRLRDSDPRLRDPIFALRGEPAAGGPATRRLWVLGSSWLGWLEDGRLTVVAEGLEVEAWASGVKGDLAIDALGGIYFGSPAAGYFFDPVERRVHGLGLREGLVAGGATAILTDRESMVWLGSLRGLSKVSSRRFLSYDRDLGLFNSEVSAVVEARPGRLILGHDGGLTFLDGQGMETLAFGRQAADVDSHRVLDMAVDDRGTVWIAAQDGGLLRLRGRTFTRELDHAFTVEIDAEGKLWVGGAAGLSVRDRAGFARIDFGLREKVGHLRWLAFGPDGRVYLAASLGLLRRDGDAWRLARGPDDEASNVFNVLASAAVVWAGTSDGLYRLEGDELVKSAAPRIDRPVYQILEDPRGRTWFGTDDGVLIWDGTNETSLRHLSVRHGLLGRETNRGAALVDHRGRVWIGTDQGLSMYQERYDAVQQVAPSLELRALEAGGSVRAAGAEVGLRHHENTLVFHVDAISFTGEEEIEVRYRLDGFDPGWQGPAPLHGSEVRYTNVPPGRYRFRIAGRRGRGEWSPEAASGPIVIAPPVWRRGWFFALMALGVGLLVSGAHGIRVQTMRARNRELETLSVQLHASIAELERAQTEREDLIEDLEAKNRELERFTYTVSHDLKSPLVTIRGFVGLLKKDAAAGEVARMNRDVERISAAAGTMGQLLDELLELSRIGRMVNPPENVALGQLVREAIEILDQQITERGVEVAISADLPAVSGDRVRLLEVVQNLIENATKFMGDQPVPRIEVGMRHDGIHPPGHAVFYVQDNGIGIDPCYHDKVFGLFERLDQSVEGTGIGLAIVQRIVEFHGGRIWVESEGNGSTFCFTLASEPSGLKHAE